MEFKKADSCRIQKSASSCLGFFSLSLTKGTDYGSFNAFFIERMSVEKKVWVTSYNLESYVIYSSTI